MTLQIILSPEASPAERVGYDFDLSTGPAILGRGPESPIPLEGTQLSREHLAFTCADGVLAITDLSSNGVWLNGQPLPKKTPVLCGPFDEVRIPGYTMTARLLLPPPPVPEQPARISRTADILVPAAPPPVQPQGAPPPQPPAFAPVWWHFDGVERWTLILAVIAIALVVLYRAG